MKIFCNLPILWFSGGAVDSDQDSRIKPKSTNSSTTDSSVDSRSDGSASDRDFVARDMGDVLQLAPSSSTSPSSENKSVGQTNPAIIAWPTINWKRSLPIGSCDDSGLLMAD
jgi:hypothetical protein